MNDRTKLVVLNEHTLGYITPGNPRDVQHLHASTLRGAPFSISKVSSVIGPNDNVRLARRRDFDEFRVVFGAFANADEYEYDPTDTGKSGASIARIDGFDSFSVDGVQYKWDADAEEYLSEHDARRRLAAGDIAVLHLDGKPILVGDPQSVRGVYKSITAAPSPGGAEEKAAYLENTGNLLGVECWEGELSISHDGGTESIDLAQTGHVLSPTPGAGHG